jgi:hypothetical protein
MTKSLNTEIELLKTYREQMANDIHDLKTDVKEIKDFLMGEEPKIVTRKEFDLYKNTQNYSKIVIGVITSVLTAFITFEVLRQFGK